MSLMVVSELEKGDDDDATRCRARTKGSKLARYHTPLLPPSNTASSLKRQARPELSTAPISSNILVFYSASILSVSLE